MNNKVKAALAWILFGIITISLIVQLPTLLANDSGEPGMLALIRVLADTLIPIIFALVGALIISRQPRNVIGLLLMLPALTAAIPSEAYLRQFSAAPADPNYLLIWFGSMGWQILIIAVLFILMLFPSGRPLTPRWRWPLYLGVGMTIIMIVGGTFADELVVTTPNASWTVPNPIGFLPLALLEGFFVLWLILMLLLIIVSVAAIFVRFRRAQGVEREQIKWLLYAGALFALVIVWNLVEDSWQVSSLWNILFALSLTLIPLAIGAAILRYRLYDIDIIIRRTLVYGVLTAVLAAVYFGVVLLAQSAFVALTGQESPIAIVISTLLIAALFNPLRRRLQSFIDRRFYRSKYDAEQALAQFAQTARDEVEMDVLIADLVGVVEETMQPQMLSIWLAADGPAVPETAASM